MLEEAHQITTQAQNVLLTETENPPDHVYYIMTTSVASKIIAPLKRRACLLELSSFTETARLLKLAAKAANYKLPIDSLCEELESTGIKSPGLILQRAEAHFSGLGISEDSEVDKDIFDTAKMISKGNWKLAAPKLKIQDPMAVKIVIINYLKSCLLGTDGDKAIKISKALILLGNTIDTELKGAIVGQLCLCCMTLK